MPEFISHDQRERLPLATMHLELERAVKFWLIALKRGAQAPVQVRIIGLPDFVADTNAAESDVTATKRQFNFLGVSCFELRTPDLIHAPAFFFLFGMTRVEDHAVAWLQRSFETHEHFVTCDSRHFTEMHAALLAETCVDQFLIVDATKPTRGKAARKGHFHLVLNVWSQKRTAISS